MPAYPDIEFQILEHLRALREELAVLHVKIEGLEQRLDVMQSAVIHTNETRPEAES